MSNFRCNWKEYKLSELGTFARGKSKHRPRDDKQLFENGKYPLIQTGEIKDTRLYVNTHSLEYGDFGLAQSKLWAKGTLCITIAANIAETAILGYPMCFPDSIVGFTADKNKCSELFIHYVFTYIRKSIQNSASGSIQDNINLDYLIKLKFKIPTKDYQNKIIAILSALDYKIELNNKINSELEKIAKTLYDYWFIQFDFPDESGRPYLSIIISNSSHILFVLETFIYVRF
jgi:type I restriction enzyme S subunit